MIAGMNTSVTLGVVALGVVAIVAWSYLILLHGRFWRAGPRLGASGSASPGPSPAPGSSPAVVAVIPARNEAGVIERAVESLLDQAYAGTLRVIVVDDHSDDSTSALVHALIRRHPRGDTLETVPAPPRPEGWVGKMWAVETGLRHLDADAHRAPEYILLTDADIVHPPDDVDRLVAKAKTGDHDLVSLMVLLEHEGAWARLLIPAFVYFFQQLYPFPSVNDRRKRIAAAAGGTMLVRAAALERVGGMAAIKDAVIDDCALARNIKAHGSIWLGLTTRTRSIRPYRGLGAIWQMVARTAFTQLGHRWTLLIATVLGLGLVYLAPPALILGLPLHGEPVAAWLGAGAWGLMAWSFVPTLKLYGRSPWLGLALPIAGLLYLGMTVDSARRHSLGRGAEWRGRAGAGLDQPE